MLLTPVTKLAPPQLHRDLIARPQLLARLAAALHVPLTVLVAPAGFGKTTLLAAWVQALAAGRLGADTDTIGPQTLWLSLDASDSDPTVLLRNLVAALQPVAPGLGADTLAALRTLQPPPLELAFAPLINDLARLKAPLVVILDDYQFSDTAPINRALSLLIERLPSAVHLVLATRTEPGLPLARLRARRKLLELRTDDLRFAPSEAADLLTELAGRALEPATIELLEQRTEGWAVGLQMAGLALRDRADQAAATALGDRYSIEFLASEVLDQLPEPLRTFLLHTSILEQLCADLCDATLGLTEDAQRSGITSQTTLEELERLGLFITPLDATRTWYRYHPLFGQLLRERLERTVTPATLAWLHRRAGAWLAAHQAPSRAIAHFIAGRRPDTAVELIEAQALPLIFSGQTHTVRGWLAALPPPLIANRPALALISGWAALFASEMTAAQQFSAAAAAALDRDPAAPQILHAELAALRAILSSFVEQYHLATSAGRMAVEQLPADSPLQPMVRAGLAFAHLLHAEPRAAETIAVAELAALPHDPAVALLRIHYQTLLAIGQRMRGGLRQALAYGEQAITLLAAVRAGAPLPSSVPALTEQATNRYEAGDCVGAAALLDEAFTLYALGRIERLSIAPRWLRARLLAADGEFAEAHMLLAAAAATAEQLDLRLSHAFTEGEIVALALRCGDLPTARRAVTALAAHTDLDVAGLRPGTELYLAPARLLLAEGQPAAALMQLSGLRRRAEAAGRGFLVLKILILTALAQAAQGDQAAAIANLRSAVERAAPEGFVRAFVDEGAPMYALLAAYPVATIAERAFVIRLLSAFPGEAAPGLAGQPLHEPLTTREQAVLRLLAAGYSNQAIAAELIVAVGTVKRHVANLAAKLGTPSRLATVVRARELGLL